MIDYLVDTIENPSLLFLNSKLASNLLIVDMGFIAMGLRNPFFTLVNENDDKIIDIELPKEALFLSQDVVTNLSKDIIKILKIYD